MHGRNGLNNIILEQLSNSLMKVSIYFPSFWAIRELIRSIIAQKMLDKDKQNQDQPSKPNQNQDQNQ